MTGSALCHSAVQCSAVQRNAIQYSGMQYSAAVQRTGQLNTVFCSVASSLLAPGHFAPSQSRLGWILDRCVVSRQEVRTLGEEEEG